MLITFVFIKMRIPRFYLTYYCFFITFLTFRYFTPFFK